jgi:hypothetical protein
MVHFEECKKKLNGGTHFSTAAIECFFEAYYALFISGMSSENHKR